MKYLLLIVLVGCGLKPQHVMYNGESRKHNTTNSIFVAYVDDFEYNGQRNVTTPINFGDALGYAGVCYVYGDGTNEVIISQTIWNNLNEVCKQVLINHELGHCVLGRSHKDGKHNNIPLSVMHSTLICGNYKAYETEYITELFTSDDTDLRDALDGV